ncbi:MAG: glycoside hydrolase family 66 protein [Eubacteriales bacterium]|nr:glycoside hydrolase family 66 protein [Eubacteriales bacterium]
MEIYPEKGRYLPGEPIGLTVWHTGEAKRFRISVFRLERKLYEMEIPRGGEQTRVSLPPAEDDFCGLGIRCETENGECAVCAADVQGTLRVFRYGFLSDFSPEDGDEADVLALAKHHVNAVQFYDWSFRHDSLVSQTEEYTDMMGKKNSLPVLRGKIAACHTRGMLALGYGAVYAASEPFSAAHPDWRLYARPGEPLRFLNVFALQNLESGWRAHIVSQYRDAVERAGFDGIHMDAYGSPKTALDAESHVVHLEDGFEMLMEQTRKELPNAVLVFNNVGNWPAERTKKTPVDAVYIEVWPPFERYEHLRQIILPAKEAKKPVVLAAYPAAFRLDTPERALNAQLILMSAIAAHGGTQLWFGEENAALTQGYYPDYARLSPQQERTLRAYDDFFVRYQTLLFDDTLADVSMTHCGWDNQEYDCDALYTASGEGGKLWLVLREQGNRKLIALVNLTGDDSSGWNAGRNAPQVLENPTIRAQVFAPVVHAWTASPDMDDGMARAVTVRTEETESGNVAVVVLPRVERFSILYLETEERI